ncbi:MAG: ABC transporter substrate-binding protein [Actinomycetota bacterium]
MRRSRSLCAFVGILMLLAACSPVEEGDSETESDQLRAGEARDGGELVIALAEEPDALDPSIARTFVGRIVFASICEKLYDVDENLEIVPQLAADLPEVSEDGLSVTIPLREGVTFNDGTEFNADAVKTTFERHLSIADSARASEIAPIKNIEVVDDLTVELELSEPFSPLTAALADRSGMIMSPQQIDALGADFGDEPVCVGPFQFVERRAQDRIVVEKSDEYYDADAVHLDRVVYRVIIEPNVRLSNLRSGDVDLAERIAATDVATIEDDDAFQLTEATSIGYQGISINIGNADGLGRPHKAPDSALASDEKLREAFELSLDRDAINEVVFDGQVVPACSPISPVTPFAIEFECPQQDIEAAKALIEESGAPTPVPVELITNNDAESVRMGEVIQSMAKDAGFDVSVRPTEFTAALDETDAGNYEAFQVGWSGRIDPDQNIHQFQHSTGSINISGTDDPEIDRLLEEARVEQDPEARKEIYQQAIEQMHEVRGIVYLYHDKLFLGANREVVGIEYFGDGLVRVRNAGFAQTEN